MTTEDEVCAVRVGEEEGIKVGERSTAVEDAGEALMPAACAALTAVSSWRGYGREEVEGEVLDPDEDEDGREEEEEGGCSGMGLNTAADTTPDALDDRRLFVCERESAPVPVRSGCELL